MKLDTLSLEQTLAVRDWRNQCLETLRTPRPLTAEEQEAFYRDVVCNPQSPHRHYAIVQESVFVGKGGLTYLSQSNASAEISLIIDPTMRRRGLGRMAAELILSEGFERLDLEVIYGEAYLTNPDRVAFWRELARVYVATMTLLPDRKRWNGRFYDSFYFSIRRPKDA